MSSVLALLYALFVAHAVAQLQCPLVLTNQQEIAALRDLYKSAGGFTWKVNTQWPRESDAVPTYNACCWIGITCTRYRNIGVRVTEINLAHNNLRGTLPDSLRNLEYLTSL